MIKIKNFNDFIEHCNQNLDSILYDTFNNASDIPVEKLTITEEEFKLITKTIVKSNLSMLRQYHYWLNGN